MDFGNLVFGTYRFEPGDEYRRFQHRFACILLLFSATVTGIFVIAALGGAAHLHPYYLWGGELYCAVFLGCYVAIRSRPAHLSRIMVPGMLVSFLLEAIAFLYNTADELRVLWFPLSIPAAYLLIGAWAGNLMTVISIAFVVVANSYLQHPYSPTAITTVVTAILYIAAVFRAFSGRSVSFHLAMVEARETAVVAHRQAEQALREVAMLLDNSGQGFLFFGPDLVVHGRYSRACVSALGREPEGHPVDMLLFSNDPDARALMRRSVARACAAWEADTPIRAEVYLSLLPRNLAVGEHYLSAQYIAVDGGVMLVLSDVTERKRLNDAVDRERHRMEMVLAAVTDQDDFFAALDGFREFVAAGSSSWSERAPVELYRAIHTFKGTFNQFGFQRLPAQLHDVETQLRELDQEPSSAQVAGMVFSIDWLNLMETDLSVITQALGKDFIERRNVVTIDPVQAVTFERFANRHLQAGDLPGEELPVLIELSRIRMASLRHALLDYERMARRMAERLGKELDRFEVSGADIRIDPDRFGPFLRSLGHVFRNAIDHGIETADARDAAGKPRGGSITCRIGRTEDGIMVEISDDGAGIDVAALRRRAADPALKDASLADLVFCDGLSSRDEANPWSGRGVGMAAVHVAARGLGGDIAIVTNQGQGTTFVFRLPAESCQVAA
ncbi:putative histidine kinase [Magnetospirillum sp. XM-1]|uniref:ATP-binding protein n=1 Tax=Magnetospirillum sp. XM-1 TaxID=1663591 RepID=UPI00073DEC20|nr:ATP-binding protein [Magnetospirillum sp. XM-1]CUW41614.1 putative histidine kinase [Magnetospirillum sp. XM-1]